MAAGANGVFVYLDRDGATLRSYVPKEGNTWNYDEGAAFGNDEESDVSFLSKWIRNNRSDLPVEITKGDPADNAGVMFDKDKIINDIADNLRV